MMGAIAEMAKPRLINIFLALIYSGVALAATATPLLLPPATSTPLSLECTKLTATGNPEYPPYLFQDSHDPNTLIGANAEIIKDIAKALNLDIEVTYSGPWSRAQRAVRNGRIDLIVGAFYTNARAKYMDYIYPAFLITRSVVWVDRNQRIEYHKKEDLIKLKGITVINNSFGQEFDDFAKTHLSLNTVSSLKQAFLMLKLGRVDYLLYEESPANAYAASFKFEGLTKTIGPEVSREGLYLTISHQSKCNTPALRERLTKALTKLLNKNQQQEALETGLSLWRQHSQNN